MLLMKNGHFLLKAYFLCLFWPIFIKIVCFPLIAYFWLGQHTGQGPFINWRWTFKLAWGEGLKYPLPSKLGFYADQLFVLINSWLVVCVRAGVRWCAAYGSAAEKILRGPSDPSLHQNDTTRVTPNLPGSLTDHTFGLNPDPRFASYFQVLFFSRVIQHWAALFWFYVRGVS